MMNPKYKKICSRIDAANAEFRLRREIELTTGQTPEMLEQSAARRQLKEHERILLEAWKNADEAMKEAIRLHEAEKGGEGHEREAQEQRQQAPKP